MDNENTHPEADAPQSPPENAKPAHQDLIVVGVGASAGGLEAFSELLKYLPLTTGMAFVLVQHLDPHHQSILSELLATKTSLRVLQVQNQTRIQPDCVYVIPPNTLMQIRDGILILQTRPPIPEMFKPIDAFFQSLAHEYQLNAVGVVLSGTATDGTLGLKAIKAEGGITFAQNQTAKFDSMPRSAIAAGVVDFVLPPRRIAEELVAISRRTTRLNSGDESLTADGMTMHRLLLLLRNNMGVDFTQYKQPTILRRLNRRMVLRKVERLEEYLDLLKKEPNEVKSLFDDLLINVTDFFRDPEVFETAKRVAFPAIVRNRKPACAIRGWIPGCSTGEEVYSIVIALVEFLESEGLDCKVQMFGTDISESTIEKARAAIYSPNAVSSVSPERLRRYFVRTESGYQISSTIREMCVFSRHNVAKDPPLSRMDVISCRNLLIYLSPSLQRRIVASFGYALQPTGCLILGSSETLGNLSEYFHALDEKHRIYSKKANLSREVFQLLDTGGEPLSAPLPPPQPSRPVERPGPGNQLHRAVNQIVLSRFGPAGLVVDESLKITEYRGDVTGYLVTPSIQPDADLMSVLRPHLRAAVGTALEQARRTEVAVVAEDIPVVADGSESAPAPVTVTVVPVSLAGVPSHFLILLGRSIDTVGLKETAAPVSGQGQNLVAPPAEDENTRLKQELKSTREYLQSVIEELRSANEEAQSSNEELQSTNEEMQTSKEELQSSNEELNTINAEMQSRNAELKQLTDDLINLLGSMNVPIVMTGPDLRIRRFTPVAEKTLRLIATDVGRPIADLKPRINVPDLEEILRRVLDTLQPYEKEVQDQEGRSYLMRARPYRTTDNRIDGTVLQLLDVTELKRSLEEVKYARDYAEAIVNTVREPLVVLNEKQTIQIANRAFYAALEQPEGATLGKTIFEVSRSRFDLPSIRAVFQRLSQGAEEVNDIEIEHRPDNGAPRTLLVNVRRLRASGQKQLFLMAFEDITERKRAAEARYRRLFESARDGIVLVDAETGELFDLNPFTERLLGYRREELVGSKLWDLEPLRDVPRIHSAVAQIRDRGVLRFDDLTLRTKDGREVQVEMVASMYKEGKRNAIQFNLRDVGERKKFERELQETQRLESLGLLAGGIAHDFNNLLTGIMGFASLALSETPADQPGRGHLRQIVEASERAAFLTRQMLAYAGRGRFVNTTIDLGEFIREISALLRTSIPRSVELNLDLAPHLPLIEVDPSQIQQVIMNLIINGAEAIGEGAPGRVTIRTSVREIDAQQAADFFQGEPAEPGTYVQLEVIDDGTGMDEATRARIFDPFFTTKFVGRGLGLAAVQGIVKGHHGAIRVYSTPGKGTSFLILLPSGARKSVSPQAAEEPAALSIPSGLVALVIDDEPTVRTLAQDVLSRAGIKVMTAENGAAGIDLFREHNPIISVVVLDLQMPVMGGEEALKRLREINPRVPVILSSGFDESEAQRRFSSLSPARFLQKPYTAERLAAAVAETVKK
jgi:two-component system CheB/CheR fusion protein